MQVLAATHASIARRAQRGLTLIEICTALAVAAVLAGTAAPSLDSIKKRRVLDGTAAEIANDLQYARSEAVARNSGVRVTVKNAASGGRCVVVHTGAAADCDCSADGQAQCTVGAVVLKSHWFPAQSAVAVTSNVSSMRFDPVRGTVTPAGTLSVALDNGNAVHHVVHPMGRVRSCSPGGTVPGYKSC